MIGDTAETFLVDTGGAESMVTSLTVKQLNLTTARSNSALVGLNGAGTDTVAKLPSITIGQFRQTGPYFFVMRVAENPNDPRKPEFAGIIAPDFLFHFDADFDFGQKKLNLISPDHCPGKVQYWSAPAVAVIPMSLDRSGHISFPMTLDGKKVSAMMDTGASSTLLNLNVARQVFGVDTNAADVEKAGELKGGYTANIYRRRFKSLTADGVAINQPMITLLPDMVSGLTSEPRRTGSLIRDDVGLPNLILGIDTLQKLHVYIAYNERKVYMTAAGPSPAPSAPAP